MLKDNNKADLRVWHTGGSVEGVQLAAKSTAGVAGEAHGIRKRSICGFLLELALHAAVMPALHLDTVFDATFGITEGSVFQLGHQLGVESCLLGGNGVQVAYTVHVVLGSSHVQRRVIVIV